METKGQLSNSLLFVLYALTTLFIGVSGFNVAISPKHMTVKPGEKVSVLCRATEAITGCRFLLPDDCVVDLSDGALFNGTSEYQYYGIGLEYGQCGITMVGLNTELFTSIACQARTKKEGWKRAAAFLRVTNAPTMQWDVEYEYRVVQPGEDVTVLCHSDVPLQTCRFGLMNGKHWVDLSRGASSPVTSQYSYYGRGLQEGQCGITLHKVTEAMSGEVRCVGAAEGNRTAGDFVSLAIAKPSDVPELSISSQLYGEFDAMRASCVVRNSIPAPKITWFIGDNVITGGIIDDSPSDVWFDHNEQKVVQNLTRRVTCEDNGKDLQCVAGPKLIAKAKINVNCVSTFTFKASPKRVTVRLGSTTSFLCRANAPLTACRFLLPGNRVVDLRDGVPSANESEYRYYGTGLANGQCGITLHVGDMQMYPVLACQGRTERAGWKRDFMFLRITNLRTMQWDVDYPTGIILPGQEINLMCQGNQPLKVCRFALMNGQLWVDVSQGHQSTKTQEYTYFGNGVEFGHCGLKLYRATEEMSGETRCVGITHDDRWAGGLISLAIAKPPADVELNLNANRYSANDLMTATCAVRNSQPAANVTWYFGDDMIRDGIRDDSPDDIWFRHNDQTVIQVLTRKLSCLDNGKELTCVAGPRYYKATKKVVMNCKTIPQSNRPSVTKLEPAEPFFTTEDGVEKTCGIPLLSNQLIVQGQATVYGHWPWTVAMFVKKTRQGGLEFLCGGTLINRKHVVTAAHCIQNGVSRPLDRDDIVLFVGKYNLNDWTEPHTQLKRVSSIHVFPDYVSTKNGSDLAVMVLSEPVVYSDYVRPICLWDKSNALEEVVGHEGTVVGWGRFGASDSFVSDVPRRATAIIVSQEECVQSNPDLSQVTNERTLCAGYKDGGGPCNGDSGSGLVVPYRPGNVGPTQWFLRGVVSLSLLDTVDQVCDLKQYVIYTDVAKYGKWMEQFSKG